MIALSLLSGDLALYINGASDGNKQGGWTYAIRNQYLSRSKDNNSWEVYSTVKASWFGLLGDKVFYLQPIDGDNGYLYLAFGNSSDKKLAEEEVRAATR